MQLETLNCNSCGAPLTVPETANFVTCNHCGAQLSIQRTPSTSFTRELEQLKASSEELADKVAYLAWQNELAAMDRRWEHEKQQYMVTDRLGHPRVPSEIDSILIGVAIIAFGVLWMVGAWNDGSISFFGIVIVAIGGLIACLSRSNAKEYRKAYRRYRRLRASITPATVMANTKNKSPQQFLSELDHIRTPEEFLQDLEESP